MTLIVNVHEAKTNFSKLLEQAHGGREIILAKAGKPYARLMPLAAAEPEPMPATGPRKPGGLKGLNLPDSFFFDPLPEDELKAWEGG